MPTTYFFLVDFPVPGLTVGVFFAAVLGVVVAAGFAGFAGFPEAGVALAFAGTLGIDLLADLAPDLVAGPAVFWETEAGVL